MCKALKHASSRMLGLPVRAGSVPKARVIPKALALHNCIACRPHGCPLSPEEAQANVVHRCMVLRRQPPAEYACALRSAAELREALRVPAHGPADDGATLRGKAKGVQDAVASLTLPEPEPEPAPEPAPEPEPESAHQETPPFEVGAAGPSAPIRLQSILASSLKVS